MKRSFRDYKIKRTCTKDYRDYHSYLNYLKKDFNNRCAYCNLLDTQITTSFEVDHFVPKNIFKNERPELETAYANLVYSCKKCNVAKGDQYEGNIKDQEIKNELFYEPEETDYGTIFFRDEAGGICSEDVKGLDMISRLRLYRPIHNLAWICEITKATLDKLTVRIETVGKESVKGKMLQGAKDELRDYYDDCLAVFIANYNNNKFEL